MQLMIVQVFIEAAILCGLLYAIARYEADYSFTKVAMVVAGLSLGSVLINATVQPHLGPWTAIVLVAFYAFMIMTFCWVSFWKSLLVVVAYSAVHFGLAFLALIVAASLIKQSSKTGMVMMGATESEFKEIQAEIQKNFSNAAEQARTRAPEIGKAAAAAHAATNPAAATGQPAAAEPAAKAPPPATTNAPPIVPRPGEDEWTTAQRTLVLGGFASGSRAAVTALVNGQMREVGDIISAPYNGQVYRWRITAIDTKGLHLQPLDKRPAE